MTARYRHRDLIACATDLFDRAGLDRPIAATVAVVLVEADLLGYATHGLQFVPAYISEIEAGTMARSGVPTIVNDTGATLLFDGRGLPGQFNVVHALELALDRLDGQSSVTVVISGGRNISCLATYVKKAAEAGAMAILCTSSPRNAAVAPFGGRQARLSTNPFAVGIPTDTTPIIIDISTASVSNRRIERARRSEERLPGPWLVDNAGNSTDDPNALFADPPGAILPSGGLDQGYKGFALSILVEALTSGLAGHGRSHALPAGGNQVFLQLIDPAAFAGRDAFIRETSHLATLCRDTEPMNPAYPVRLPGDRAMALYAEQLERGVSLHADILPRMAPMLKKYGLPLPCPIAD